MNPLPTIPILSFSVPIAPSFEVSTHNLRYASHLSQRNMKIVQRDRALRKASSLRRSRRLWLSGKCRSSVLQRPLHIVNYRHDEAKRSLSGRVEESPTARPPPSGGQRCTDPRINEASTASAHFPGKPASERHPAGKSHKYSNDPGAMHELDNRNTRPRFRETGNRGDTSRLRAADRRRTGCDQRT